MEGKEGVEREMGQEGRADLSLSDKLGLWAMKDHLEYNQNQEWWQNKTGFSE